MEERFVLISTQCGVHRPLFKLQKLLSLISTTFEIICPSNASSVNVLC